MTTLADLDDEDIGVDEIGPGQLRRWRENPVAWNYELFRGLEELDYWEIDYWTAFADPQKRRIALSAAKGAGKSSNLARTILHFLMCYGTVDDHPNGYAMSITLQNLKDNLWKELAVWYKRSPLCMELFELNTQRIYYRKHPETWFISSRGWGKEADEAQMSGRGAGLHGKFTLVIPDEVAGIAQAAMAEALGSLSTSGWHKIVMGGNSTHREGPLYAAVVEHPELWHVLRVTGDPLDPKRAKRISKQWCEEMIAEYGIDSPFVQVGVYNNFPDVSLNALFGRAQLKELAKRNTSPDLWQNSQKRLGGDIGLRHDLTVLWPRQGWAAMKPVEMRNVSPTEIVQRMVASEARWNWDMAFIDQGGPGAGIVDFASRACKSSVIGVDFGGSADDPRAYANKRAEMAFRMKYWMDSELAMMPDLSDDAIEEFTAITYTTDKHGRLLLEPKDWIKEKIGRSTDRPDGLMTTFAFAEMPGPGTLIERLLERRSEVARYEWDVLQARRGEESAIADHDWRVI